jgi:hypothetical protein
MIDKKYTLFFMSLICKNIITQALKSVALLLQTNF